MHAMNPDWSCNIFHGLLAHVVKLKSELVLYLVVHNARHHDAARIGKRFQPCGHVDAVAINVVTINYDIADIDADSKLDTFLGRNISIAFNHAALDIDGAAHGINDANELHQYAVSGSFDYATTVFG